MTKCRNQISCRVNIVVVKNLNVAFEIAVKLNEVIDWNIENDSVFDDCVFFVREILPCHKHIVQGCVDFTSNGISCFTPAASAFSHKETPATETFGMGANNAIGTPDKCCV